jgi:hypothetical protein
VQSTVNQPRVPAPDAGDRFIGGPVRYVSPDHVYHEPAVTPTDAGETLWTCPMHPQIIRTEPGFCPICGVALEPMTEPGRRPKGPSRLRGIWAKSDRRATNTPATPTIYRVCGYPFREAFQCAQWT